MKVNGSSAKAIVLLANGPKFQCRDTVDARVLPRHPPVSHCSYYHGICRRCSNDDDDDDEWVWLQQSGHARRFLRLADEGGKENLPRPFLYCRHANVASQNATACAAAP